MTAALIGFLGVVVGSLLSGGIQSYRVWSDRRAAGRVAARLVDIALSEAGLTVHILGTGHVVVDEEVAALQATWEKHQQALAHVLPAQQFELVGRAFLGLSGLERMHGREIFRPGAAAATDQERENNAKMIESMKALMERAQLALEPARHTWRERRQLPGRDQDDAALIARINANLIEDD